MGQNALAHPGHLQYNTFATFIAVMQRQSNFLARNDPDFDPRQDEPV